MKSETPVLTIDEMNEVIIKLLKGRLDKFCFGEYKDEANLINDALLFSKPGMPL